MLTGYIHSTLCFHDMLIIPNVCHDRADKHNHQRDEPLRASVPPSRVKFEWVCLRLFPTGGAPPTSSTVPLSQPPPVIGSALTLLNQSGIFNCACCWVSVHQLTPHTFRADVTRAQATLSPAHLWSTTVSSCSGYAASMWVSGRC